MATMKAFLVTASCGLMLLSAVSAHAKLSVNKLSANRLASNRLSANKLTANGTSLNGITPNALTPPVSSDTTLDTPPSEGLSLYGLSQRRLGKPVFDSRTP
jgi:hypothetical protein